MEMDDSTCTTSIEPVAAAPAPAEIQSFDHATVRSEVLDNASERGASIQEMDDSRLVGVPVAVEAKPAPVTNVIVGGEKRKRGRPKGAAAAAKPPPKIKMEEEDVCFICFDGGSLVLCDRKGCPKAYHPACIKRDEAFFRCKAKWNCGWHICSVCQKSSHFMCYTCTYSLCKGCTEDADFSFVRGNMGFCTVCMRTIMLIENKDLAKKELVQVDFDDKSSWEYLFKVYWILLKEKLSLTLDELTKAKNPSKGVVSVACKQLLPDTQHVGHHSNGFLSYGPHGHSNLNKPNDLNLTTDKPKEETTETTCNVNGASLNAQTEWASKELLDFVAHMKNGDRSVLSQSDVEVLLLEYVKKNSLRDPRRKNQIICDLRLKNLFGKPRVGCIEMLKLLECHLLIKEDSQKNTFIPAGIVGGIASPFGCEDASGSSLLENKNKRRKTCKKVEEREPKNNLDEYAAIDVHNMNLIYMRRDLMENLIEDEKFRDKVVGSIVRIRISSSDQKQELYRLVEVIGISKVAVPYRSGEKTVDIMLEVFNLNKKEAITVDAISNQEFSEEECRRLRQSIRCGLVKHFTVGEIEKKAMELQAVRLNYILEEEILKLNHLRDEASEEEHKKEIRECIEKLELLKSPEERQCRQCEIPEVHADPKMNPDYESEEDSGVVNDKRQDEYTRPTHSGPDGFGNKPITSKRKVKEEGLINHQRKINRKTDANCLSDQAMTRLAPEIPTTANHSTGNSYSPSDSETDKLWHYRDPSGKSQGPFSMEQLQKWSTTGYFPPDMRIWTIDEQDDSILLTDALNGTFHTAAHLLYNFSLHCQQLGAASDNRTHSSDVGYNEKMDRPGNDSQIVEASLSSNARVQSDNSNEFVRTDGLGSISFSSSSVVSGKEIQPGTSESPEMKDSNSCSDHSQVCHPPPSSDVGHSHAALPCEEQGQVSEGSRPTPYLENKVSHGAASYQIPEAQNENQSNSKSCLRQSSGQNWRSFPINLNSDAPDTDCGFSPMTKSDSSGQDGDADLPVFPSPTPKDSNWEPEGQAAEMLQPVSQDVPVEVSDMRHLRSPTPKPANENQGQPAESKTAKVAGQDSVPSWSSASSLVVGGAQFPETADEWGRYSSTHAKPSAEELSSGLVSVSSMKQPEVVGDHATPTSNINPFAHTSPSHPTSNASSWHLIIEPIEFSTLAEESVSDLLAEVDAMESQSGLSPTSAMRRGDEMMRGYKNDSFSIEDLSPSPDPGKSDAFSSTGDIHLPCQSTVTDEPVGASQVDAYDPLKLSSGHSSTSSEGETKSADIPANQGEAGSTVHPRLSHTTSQQITETTMPRSTGVAGMDTVWGRLPGHVNLNWGAPAQGISNIGWVANQGALWGNLNVHGGPFNGGVVWDGQRKHAGPVDWVQGVDMGYGRGRPFWNRPPPKGQRVCKFYESGRCKKGASCDYLHP